MRIHPRAPQGETSGTKSGSQASSPTPSPSPSPGTKDGNGSGATIAKDKDGDEWATLSSNSSSPDSISNLLSPLPLPQKARIENGTGDAQAKNGKPAILRPTTLLVPPPPGIHPAANHPSQLMGAFLGSFFVLLLGLCVIFLWRLRTRRKRKEVKDHKAWLKVQMRTPGSEAAFKAPASVMTSLSRSTYSKSISAYSKSLYSCSDASTNLGSDLSSSKSISNLYTVPPASWSDLSAQPRNDQRRVAFQQPAIPGTEGLLVVPRCGGPEIRQIMSMSALGERYQGGTAFGPLHNRRSSVTARLDLDALSSAAAGSQQTFDPSSGLMPRPATCRPSTHSQKSRWSLSESFDDIDEAAMWLPAKSSDPPEGEHRQEGQGATGGEGTEDATAGSPTGESSVSSGATLVEAIEEARRKACGGEAKEEDEDRRLEKELEELEASCGRISIEALGRAQQTRLPTSRPSRVQRQLTRLSIVSEGAETASIAPLSGRPPSMLSQASKN